MTFKRVVLTLIIALCCSHSFVYAATNDTPPGLQPKRMDGVNLQPVETYVDPKTEVISAGIGLYPFDSYFYGLSLNLGYTKTLEHDLSWEVINISYFLALQKDVTAELATGDPTPKNIPVDPSTIPRLNFIITSDYQYIFLYGKFTSFEKDIRYFRASAIGGLGIVKKSDKFAPATVMGLKIQTFTRDSFSWDFELRDNLAILSGLGNYMTFNLGASFSL